MSAKAMNSSHHEDDDDNHQPTSNGSASGTAGATIITPPELRRGSPFLTRFEIAKIVGERAQQIAASGVGSATIAALSSSSLLPSSNGGGGGGNESDSDASPHSHHHHHRHHSHNSNKHGGTASNNSGGGGGSYCVPSAAALAALPPAVLTGRNEAIAQVVDCTAYHHVNIIELAERSKDGISLVHDPVMMAKYELLQRRLPVMVTRRFPDGWVEHVPAAELEVDMGLLDLHF